MSVNYDPQKTAKYNATPLSLADGDTVPPQVDATGKLLVNAEVTANISGAQEVIISAVDDSIKIGDGAGHFAAVNADGSLNVTGTSAVTGTVDTNLNGLTTFQTSQYTVGVSAVQLTPSPLANRSSMSVKAILTGSNVAYVGNSSGVTPSTGYPLFNGDSVQLDLIPGQAVWAICTAAAQTLAVLEIGG